MFRKMADFFMEYGLPVIGLIILVGLAVLVIEAVLWVGTTLVQGWCG